MLDNKDLLCKVGSELLVRCANDYKVQVIALAEKTKFLSKTINQKELDAINDFIAVEEPKDHPELDICCIEPRMDLVSSNLVDVLITEEGNMAQIEPTVNS